MITENLSTLKIHKLTQEQYDRELLNGTLDASALYLTPDEEIDLSGCATVEQLSAKADATHTHDASVITVEVDSTDEKPCYYIGDGTLEDALRVLDSAIDDLDGYVTTMQTKVNAIPDTYATKTALADKADKAQGVFYIEGDSGSTTDTTNKVATWIGSHDEITEYFSGLTILYKVVTAGSTTTTLNINNLGAVTVVRNATTGISTSCPVNGVLLLTYTVDSDGTAYWKTADYDANTKNTAGTSNKTGTKLFLVGGASQSSSGVTTYSNSNVYINTSNQLYSAQGFSGNLTGNADTATKATQDASGNVIADTYATKTELTAKADASHTHDATEITVDALSMENPTLYITDGTLDEVLWTLDDTISTLRADFTMIQTKVNLYTKRALTVTYEDGTSETINLVVSA